MSEPFCAVCCDRITHGYWEPLGRDGGLVRVCTSCATDHATDKPASAAGYTIGGYDDLPERTGPDDRPIGGSGANDLHTSRLARRRLTYQARTNKRKAAQ